jgi:hypothetical protein
VPGAFGSASATSKPSRGERNNDKDSVATNDHGNTDANSPKELWADAERPPSKSALDRSAA